MLISTHDSKDPNKLPSFDAAYGQIVNKKKFFFSYSEENKEKIMKKNNDLGKDGRSDVRYELRTRVQSACAKQIDAYLRTIVSKSFRKQRLIICWR